MFGGAVFNVSVTFTSLTRITLQTFTQFSHFLAARSSYRREARAVTEKRISGKVSTHIAMAAEKMLLKGSLA